YSAGYYGKIDASVSGNLDVVISQVERDVGSYQGNNAYGADVPPVLSSTANWSPIPQSEEIGREEALFRRADHRLPARGRGRTAGQGAVPQARLQRGVVLPVAEQVRRHERARCQAPEGA